MSRRHRSRSTTALQPYRCRSCSGGTALAYRGDPVKSRECLRCLHDRVRQSREELKAMLTSRDGRRLLRDFASASEQLLYLAREELHRAQQAVRQLSGSASPPA